MIAVAAALGSGIGALARYELGGLVQRRANSLRPWGTAVVNLIGAIALGVLVGLAADGRIHADVLTIAGAGFCGGFTTFSTWMVESVRLGEEGGRSGLVAAVLNVVLMFVLGVAAAALTTSFA